MFDRWRQLKRFHRLCILSNKAIKKVQSWRLFLPKTIEKWLHNYTHWTIYYRNCSFHRFVTLRPIKTSTKEQRKKICLNTLWTCAAEARHSSTFELCATNLAAGSIIIYSFDSCRFSAHTHMIFRSWFSRCGWIHGERTWNMRNFKTTTLIKGFKLITFISLGPMRMRRKWHAREWKCCDSFALKSYLAK